MSNFEEFLIEFEKYLEKKFWNFKKYEIENAFLYDIEEVVTILIEEKEEFSKHHITCKELLNIEKADKYGGSYIKIKPFCAEYVKDWVTFYSFNGKITKELKLVNEKILF